MGQRCRSRRPRRSNRKIAGAAISPYAVALWSPTKDGIWRFWLDERAREDQPHEKKRTHGALTGNKSQLSTKGSIKVATKEITTKTVGEIQFWGYKWGYI